MVHVLSYIIPNPTFVLESSFWISNNGLPSFRMYGAFALFIIVLMTLTSNRWAVNWLGKQWKRLHRFVYAAILLVVIHAPCGIGIREKMILSPLFFWQSTFLGRSGIGNESPLHQKRPIQKIKNGSVYRVVFSMILLWVILIVALLLVLPSPIFQKIGNALSVVRKSRILSRMNRIISSHASQEQSSKNTS